MNLPHYHENQKLLHVGTMPKRAYYVPASNVKKAGLHRTASDRFESLNGVWGFSYFESDRELPEGFEKKDFSMDAMGTLPVPSCWQNYGYGAHCYANKRYPIPYDPPFVPTKNACGLYIRDFEIPRDDLERSLVFEGVDSCYYVYMNGEFLGYTQNSHNPSEFDITAFVHPGKNRLTVLVYRWCDGTYLEDQDKLRMSGIFRDVYILARPQNRVTDFFCHESFHNGYSDATLTIDFSFKGKVSGTVTLMDGKNVKDSAELSQKTVLSIKDPVLWNAESPYLYTLIVETSEESIVRKIGFREICVIDKIVYINGQKIKFKGTNRHDSSPVNGYAVTEDEIRKDLEIMKNHNFNAIRTSHYPNSPLLYEMADEMGFYVIDETDLEIHGVTLLYGNDREDWGNASFCLLADDPEWAEPILDRVEALVERDKNVTCVVIWSLGNEGGYGGNFEKAAAWVRKRDASRLIHYESSVHARRYDPNAFDGTQLFEYRSYERPDGKFDFSNLDFYSRMYPSLEECERILKEEDKNFIMCEYTHSMGNGPGDAEDYWQLIYKHDTFSGAFVWEWCDHAVYMGKTADGRDKYFYGGDWNEKQHDYNFCMDGLNYPDRRPHTGLLDITNVLRPVRLTKAEGNTFTFKNMLDFTDMEDHIGIFAELKKDGKVLKKELFKVEAKPHKTVSITLPWAIPSDERTTVTFTYVNTEKDSPSYMPKQFGFDQYIVPVETWDLALDSLHAPKVTDLDHTLIIENRQFRYVFDKDLGHFTSLVNRGVNYLASPVETNIFRAPTDNDRNIRVEWLKAHYDEAFCRVYKVDVSEEDNCAVIEVTYSVGANATQRFINGKNRYEIGEGGEILVTLTMDKLTALPMLPRFGLRLMLPQGFEKVSYYGYGPMESYIDKHRAAHLDRFTSSVSALHEDYIKPQENGSHYGCEEMTLTNGEGHSVTVIGNGFSFNASHYTQEELMNKGHNFELEARKETVLCVDAAMGGIGSNSCGPVLAKQYRVPDSLSKTMVFLFD